MTGGVVKNELYHQSHGFSAVCELRFKNVSLFINAAAQEIHGMK